MKVCNTLSALNSMRGPARPLVAALNDCEKSLADLFIVYGVPRAAIQAAQSEPGLRSLAPQILDSYPRSIKHEEILSLNLSYLCFPEGYKLIEVKPSKDPIKSQHSLNHITMTTDVGEKKYATSLLFYEIVSFASEASKSGDCLLVPMSFCVISQLPLFDLQRRWLIEVYEAYIASRADRSRASKKYTMEFYISLLFHHFYYNSEWQNEVEIFYRDAHRQRKTFARYRNYKQFGFTLPNFTFQPLLEAVKPNRILELVKCLLLEKKILLVRNQYSDNAVIIESLLMLLAPFQWTFVNISYLSDSMIDYIDAPMPFIMGVPRHLWKDIKRQRAETIPTDIVIFDIDKNKLTCNENLPDLPPRAAESVYATMLAITDEKERIMSTCKVPAEREARVNSLPQPWQLAEFWVQATLRLKQSFLNMFFCLINNYLICYKESTLTAKPNEDSLPQTAADIYDFEKYQSFFDDQRRPFMTELCKTQSFMNFVERSHKTRDEKNEVSFFAEGVRLCAEKGDKALATRVKRITEQLLERNKKVRMECNMIAQPVSFSLEECYKLYQGKLGATSKAPRSLLDIDKVVQMPKVNYFQSRANDINGYIFAKPRNLGPAPLVRSDTEAALTCKKTVCLQGTLRLLPCRVPLDESSEITEDEGGNVVCEDYSIAEEFNDDEEHISADLARREVERCYRFPELSNTPRPKLGGANGLAALFDRKRSVTLMPAASTRGLFLRANSGRLGQAVGLLNRREVKGAGVVQVQAQPKENVPLFGAGSNKHIRVEAPMRPVMQVLSNAAVVSVSMAGKHAGERPRTSSIDSRRMDNGTCGVPLLGRPGRLKENAAVDKISAAATSDGMLSGTKEGHIERAFKDQFAVLLNKGPHKFSNTAQAQPKVLVKRVDTAELRASKERCECSEVQGDELTTLRTVRPAHA